MIHRYNSLQSKMTDVLQDVKFTDQKIVRMALETLSYVQQQVGESAVDELDVRDPAVLLFENSDKRFRICYTGIRFRLTNVYPLCYI